MPRVPLLTQGRAGPELVEAEVSESDASLAGRYWSAGYARFLESGDVEALRQFEGEMIGGLPLMTDPDSIEDFYFEHGHIDFQEYYTP